MSKIMFVSDVHLTPRVPIARKDDYPQTVLNKVEALGKISQAHGVSDIFFLGDIFNTKHMTLPYFIKCYDKFNALVSMGLKLHTVVGNHDILYNTEDTMQESPLSIMFNSNVIDNAEHITIDNVTVHQYNYLTKLENIPNCPHDDKYHILSCHYFYNLGFGDEDHTLSMELCDKLGYNAYILGHDHTPYKPVVKSNYQVHRPGSLTRGTSQTCQVNRDSIQVLLLDSNTLEFEYVDLPNILLSTDVYREDHLIISDSITSLSESLQDFLKALEFNNSSDIFETLNSIPMDKKVKDCIISYLSNEGIYEQGVM